MLHNETENLGIGLGTRLHETSIIVHVGAKSATVDSCLGLIGPRQLAQPPPGLYLLLMLHVDSFSV